jgi:hypothetical protein
VCEPCHLIVAGVRGTRTSVRYTRAGIVDPTGSGLRSSDGKIVAFLDIRELVDDGSWILVATSFSNSLYNNYFREDAFFTAVFSCMQSKVIPQVVGVSYL